MAKIIVIWCDGTGISPGEELVRYVAVARNQRLSVLARSCASNAASVADFPLLPLCAGGGLIGQALTSVFEDYSIIIQFVGGSVKPKALGNELWRLGLAKVDGSLTATPGGLASRLSPLATAKLRRTTLT